MTATGSEVSRRIVLAWETRRLFRKRFGGIKINQKAEAINADYAAIPGLYAAGDCANGLVSYNTSLMYHLGRNPWFCGEFGKDRGRKRGRLDSCAVSFKINPCDANRQRKIRGISAAGSGPLRSICKGVLSERWMYILPDGK